MIYVYRRRNIDGLNEDQDIKKYVTLNGISIDKYCKAQKLNYILSQMSSGDMLLVSSISCLGNSLLSVKKAINTCLDKNIKIIIINGNYIFEDTPQNRLLLSAVDMVIRMQTELKSQIMCNTLNLLRRKGKRIGRPRGCGNKKLKLSGREAEIRIFLEKKLSKSEIARRLGVNRVTLHTFLKRMSK